MCQCEDRPCCGHPAEERADDAYRAEREYYGDHYDDHDDYEDEEESPWCDRCGGNYEDPESDEACCCGGGDSWGSEDSALESSIFGDC